MQILNLMSCWIQMKKNLEDFIIKSNNKAQRARIFKFVAFKPFNVQKTLMKNRVKINETDNTINRYNSNSAISNTSSQRSILRASTPISQNQGNTNTNRDNSVNINSNNNNNNNNNNNTNNYNNTNNNNINNNNNYNTHNNQQQRFNPYSKSNNRYVPNNNQNNSNQGLRSNHNSNFQQQRYRNYR